MELLREAHGVSPCDARRPRSVAAARFPSFDFSAVETEDDTWHQRSVRERVQDFETKFSHFHLDLSETSS